MTENLAGRGEGLKGLVAKWRDLYANAGTKRAGDNIRRAAMEHCADELESEIAALEAAARLSADTEIANLIAFHEKETDVWAEQLSILRITCDAHIHTIEDMQREIDELKVLATPSPQPSGQWCELVREAHGPAEQCRQDEHAFNVCGGCGLREEYWERWPECRRAKS